MVIKYNAVLLQYTTTNTSVFSIKTAQKDTKPHLDLVSVQIILPKPFYILAAISSNVLIHQWEKVFLCIFELKISFFNVCKVVQSSQSNTSISYFYKRKRTV